MTTYCFQVIKCEYLQLLFTSYDNKLNIWRLWTVGEIKTSNLKMSLSLLKFFFTILWQVVAIKSPRLIKIYNEWVVPGLYYIIILHTDVHTQLHFMLNCLLTRVFNHFTNKEMNVVQHELYQQCCSVTSLLSPALHHHLDLLTSLQL